MCVHNEHMCVFYKLMCVFIKFDITSATLRHYRKVQWGRVGDLSQKWRGRVVEEESWLKECTRSARQQSGSKTNTDFRTVVRNKTVLVFFNATENPTGIS